MKVPTRWVRLGFGLLIWAGLVAALLAGWEAASDSVERAFPWLVAAVPLILIGLLGGARGWASLQPRELQPRAFRAFLASQPAKYLPGGGAFQLAGQVGMTAPSRTDYARTGVTFVVHAVIQAAAACVAGLLLLVPGVGVPTWLRGLAVASAVGSLLILRKPALERGLAWVQRFFRRIDLKGSIAPTTALRVSWAWSLIPMLLSGLAFAGLAGQWSAVPTALRTMGVFAAAWLAGFLAFPLPSGLGLREVVLVGLLPALPSSQVIATSLLHRLATLAAELLILLFVSRGAFVLSKTDEA